MHVGDLWSLNFFFRKTAYCLLLAVVFLVGEQYYMLIALDQSSFLFIAGKFVLMLEVYLKMVETLKSISFLLEMLFICLLFSTCIVFSL